MERPDLALSPPSCCFLAQVKIVFLFLVNHQKVENLSTKIYQITAWMDQNGQNEIMAFLACLFDANQLLL